MKMLMRCERFIHTSRDNSRRPWARLAEHGAMEIASPTSPTRVRVGGASLATTATIYDRSRELLCT